MVFILFPLQKTVIHPLARNDLAYELARPSALGKNSTVSKTVIAFLLTEYDAWMSLEAIAH